MNIRISTLWRVPVFYLCASWICFYLTVYLGFLYLVKTTGADGVTEVSIDPIRNAIFDLVLLLAVFLLGGLWAFRGMTKVEIFCSAAILVAVYLVINLLQIFFDVPPSLSITLAKFQNLNGTISSLLRRLTDQLELSVLISDLTPFLFIPFGKRAPR